MTIARSANALAHSAGRPAQVLACLSSATPSTTRAIAFQARTIPVASQLIVPQPSAARTVRHFSQSVPRAKKEGKAKSSKTKGAPSALKEDGGSGGSKDRLQPDPEDAFNMADMEQGFDRAARRYEEELRQLRSGGRFHPDAVGAVPVRPDKKDGAVYPLRELAQVAPKGPRTLSILVSEERLLKAVQSAILASNDYNQMPQVAEDNELELLLKVEPEPAEALAKRAKDLLNKWRDEVRAERHKRDVVHKKWAKDGTVTTDSKKRLDKELQKAQDARMTAIGNKEKEILKHINSMGGN